MWRKSSFSGNVNSDCVEVALTAPGALVRDSKDPGGEVLRVPVVAWWQLVGVALVSRGDG